MQHAEHAGDPRESLLGLGPADGQRARGREAPAGQPANPNDAAYDWWLYDRRSVHTLSGTGSRSCSRSTARPAGPTAAAAPNVRRLGRADLRNFAYAAARRYSGSFLPPATTAYAAPLPAVRHWLAWNEPNNPVFLRRSTGSGKGRSVIQSAVDYAKICNAVYTGVKTDAAQGREGRLRGHRAPRQQLTRGSRAAVGVAAGVPPRRQARRDEALRRLRPPPVLRPSDARRRRRSRRRRPPSCSATSTTSIKELTRLYGTKRSGSPSTATRRARPTGSSASPTRSRRATSSRRSRSRRKNPRIDMMLWFLLRDQRAARRLAVRADDRSAGKRKPAFTAFQRLPR